jgi:hypothetical protein
MPDYEAMSGADFQRAVGDDPEKWADAAAQNAVTQGYRVERDWLRVWFGDAMEAGRKGSIQDAIKPVIAELKTFRDEALELLERARDDA